MYSHFGELLPAVDVKGGDCKGRVCHDMYGQRGHIGWSDHPADRQRGAQLLATGVQAVCRGSTPTTKPAATRLMPIWISIPANPGAALMTSGAPRSFRQ
jgi:hypothetical protein